MDWPPQPEFRYCPCCLESTDPVSNAEAMDSEDARRLRLNFEFERYYEERERTLPPLEERCTDAVSSTP